MRVDDLLQLPRLGWDCMKSGCNLSTAAASDTDMHLYVGSAWSKVTGVSGQMSSHCFG